MSLPVLGSDMRCNTKPMAGLFVHVVNQSNTSMVPTVYYTFMKINAIHMITLWYRYNYSARFAADTVEMLKVK